ncbi:MAG: hypothetical protein J6U09_05035 [Lachnospiraceae bacterium]|nr:hypothetical protein [Lachnospiraceae bacterium]
MNKRLISTILLSASFLISLTGCFNAIPEMTEEEEKMVVRYMADAVIQNDVSYQSRLLDEEEKEAALAEEARKAEELKKIEEEQKLKEEKKKAEEDSASSSSTPTEVVEKVYTPADMASIMELENVSFEYVGYETGNVYPMDIEDLGFGYSAHENSSLLVISFNVSNTSSEDMELDLSKIKAKYRIKINGEKKFTPDFIPLNTIMTMFKDTIPAGGSVKLDLVYEIPDDTDIDTLDLFIINNDKDSFKIGLE